MLESTRHLSPARPGHGRRGFWALFRLALAPCSLKGGSRLVTCSCLNTELVRGAGRQGHRRQVEKMWPGDSQTLMNMWSAK